MRPCFAADFGLDFSRPCLLHGRFFCKLSIALSGVCFRKGGGVMSEPVRGNRMNKEGRRERKCPNM